MNDISYNPEDYAFIPKQNRPFEKELNELSKTIDNHITNLPSVQVNYNDSNHYMKNLYVPDFESDDRTLVQKIKDIWRTNVNGISKDLILQEHQLSKVNRLVQAIDASAPEVKEAMEKIRNGYNELKESQFGFNKYIRELASKYKEMEQELDAKKELLEDEVDTYMVQVKGFVFDYEKEYTRQHFTPEVQDLFEQSSRMEIEELSKSILTLQHDMKFIERNLERYTRSLKSVKYTLKQYQHIGEKLEEDWYEIMMTLKEFKMCAYPKLMMVQGIKRLECFAQQVNSLKKSMGVIDKIASDVGYKIAEQGLGVDKDTSYNDLADAQIELEAALEADAIVNGNSDRKEKTRKLVDEILGNNNS